MSAFRRPGSKMYYIGPFFIEGVGELPRMSTAQRTKSIAQQMEAAVKELALTGFKDLIVQLRDGKVKLVELWQAKLEGRESLEYLRDRQKDQPLPTAIEARKEAVVDERVRTGYDQLTRFLPDAEKRVAAELGRAALDPIRVSWLLELVHVTTLYEIAVASGLKRNTVRRGLHRAVADLLTRRFSRGRMLAVMADAGTPGENDERVVMLSSDEVQKAFDACDDEMRPVFGLALCTGVDRTPMLSLRVGDYDEQLGSLSVVTDRKTQARPRLLLLRGEPVLDKAEYWLRRLTAGRAADEPLIGLTPKALRSRWEAIRTAIGRPDVRWKDIRGIFGTYYLMAGGDPRNLQHIYGHTSMSMVMRYLRRVPAGNRETLKAVASRIGLLGGKSHLRVVEGGQ